MPNPAVPSDVDARHPDVAPVDPIVAATLLGDAWAMLLARTATLEANMTSGAVLTVNVRRVLCAMVARVLRNPGGWSEEAIDDYRRRRDGAGASGALEVLPGELADVTPATSRPSAFTIRVRTGLYGVPDG